MKTLWKIVIVCVLVSFVVACGAKTAEVPAGELSAEEQWLKDNQLGKYFTLDQDWQRSKPPPSWKAKWSSMPALPA